jgi:predicted nucleic acid-binding protein
MWSATACAWFSTFLEKALLCSLPVRLDHNAEDRIVMALTRRHRLTAYDAGYLELAQRAGIPLATLDEALMRAARTEHVLLIGE